MPVSPRNKRGWKQKTDQRKNILIELCNSERNYLSHLRNLQETKTHIQQCSILPEETTEAIFGNVSHKTHTHTHSLSLSHTHNITHTTTTCHSQYYTTIGGRNREYNERLFGGVGYSAIILGQLSWDDGRSADNTHILPLFKAFQIVCKVHQQLREVRSNNHGVTP